MRATQRPAPRLRARRGQGGQLREELLAAAERLLAATGDEDAVSIRAIADAVGVTPAAIYLHFPDKDALILEVCAVRFADLARALDAAAVDVDDPVEAVIALGKAYVRFGLDHPEQYRILFMRKNASRKLQPEELRDTLAFGQLVTAVERCVRHGAISAPVMATALELWAVAHGAASLMIGMPAFKWPDEFAEQTLRTYVRGLMSADVTSS